MWISTTVHAGIQTYQIRRLVLYQTDCRPDSIEETTGQSDDARTFKVTCSDPTFYPDGIGIRCADADDERSCRILTVRRSFDRLQLMRPSTPEPDRAD